MVGKSEFKMKLLYVFKERANIYRARMAYLVIILKADVREIAVAAVRPIHQKKMRTK